MLKHALIALILLVLANVATANKDLVVQQAHDPKTFIESLGDRTIAILTDKSMPESKRVTKLEELFDEYVATNWMANFALGSYRRQASDAQIRQFEEVYHQFLIKKYMPKFKSYTGEKLGVRNAESISDKDTMVRTEIVRENGPTVHVDYLLRQGLDSDPYKVIDIVAEGISLINTHRSEFGAILAQKGIDGFITTMRERVSDPESSSGD